MIACYLLAVCTSSSIDKDSNSTSLFNLVESAQLTAFIPGDLIQLQVHMGLEATPDDIGKEVETRIIWVAESGEETVSEPHTLPFPMKRIRVRSLFLRLPPAPGSYRLFAEWRRLGGDAWERSSCHWPLELQAAPQPEAAL